MTESGDAPMGRKEAFELLRSRLDGLSELAGQLDAAGDDRERRSVLLSLITAGWAVRDHAADAYAALERAIDEDRLGKGVLG
jgi:hypothetical protein